MTEEILKKEKKKFNGFIYIFSLLISVVVTSISNVGTEQNFYFSGQSGYGVKDYIIDQILGAVLAVLFISYLLYKILNWLYINVFKE